MPKSDALPKMRPFAVYKCFFGGIPAIITTPPSPSSDVMSSISPLWMSSLKVGDGSFVGCCRRRIGFLGFDFLGCTLELDFLIIFRLSKRRT